MSRDLNPKMIQFDYFTPHFFQILTVGLLNLVLYCKLLDVTESEKDRGGFSSMGKLCINRDNPSATKLPVMVEILSGRILPNKQLFTLPCMTVCQKKGKA